MKERYTPILLAGCVVIGIMIGTFYANHFSGNRLNIINSGSNRLNNLLHIINDQYVDNVNIDSLVEKAIPQILSKLDPHSVYLSASEVQIANDELKGSFSGVGIEFNIQNDTIHVQNVVKNGPSERAGILAGDKIITIDDSLFVGKVVTNQEAIRRLRGPKDTKVKIGVKRFGQKEIRQFTITRGEIPQRSITAVHMLDDETGYIYIKNFGETTYAELLVALATLSQQGFENLVIDLRNNTGGYLERAVQISNEFLPRNKLIVYTQGRKSPRQEYRSDGHGSYQDIPLIVLINDISASASEIFAGAMQDNDRATIIGRRSFGKGLVQQQIEFNDQSLIRLTIARYYTPSGRCIQKPYDAGNSADYELEIGSRYQHGEWFSQDSIKHTGPAYHTGIGREVYGGGGITPDIFIPEDTTNFTSYFYHALRLTPQFSSNYTDDNRMKLKELKETAKLSNYLEKQNLVEKFATYAEKRGLKRRNLMIHKSHKLLERDIISRIVNNILDENGYRQYMNHDDPTVIEALKIFKAGESFPQKPVTPATEKKKK